MTKRQIEVGMVWNKDWHTFAVQSISEDGKTCEISEDWISEDSGEPIHRTYNYNISEDESGQFVWEDKYKEYAFNEKEEDGYSWWARMYACGADHWDGLTEEEVIKELEEQGYEVKEQETTTTDKEEKDMARFEVNGVIYEANEKGNYFYKSTGSVDKKGNPLMKRISRAVYEQAFEEYTQAAQDDADAWETEMDEAKADARAEQDRKDAETEDTFNKKHGMETPKSALDTNKKHTEKTGKKAKRSKDVAFRHQDITLTAKQVAFIKEAQQTSFYENGVQSTLWCDVLVDEIGGEFAGKPMTVGAMISTLKEKDLIFVAFEKVNGKKSKYFGFTELGQMILKELD